MRRTVAEIERDIRGLAAEDKEYLLQVLVDELEGQQDPEIERAWLEEAQRRSEAADRGEMASISSEELFRELRTTLLRR